MPSHHRGAPRATLALVVSVFPALFGCGGSVNVDYEPRSPDGPARNPARVAIITIDCPDPLTDPRQCGDRGAPFTANVRGVFRASDKAFAHWDRFRDRVVAVGAKHGCDAVAIRRIPPNAPRTSLPIGAFCVDLATPGAPQDGATAAPTPDPITAVGMKCNADAECPAPGHCTHGVCQ